MDERDDLAGGGLLPGPSTVARRGRDLLIGLVVLAAAFPRTARILGFPSITSWGAAAALALVGLSSLGYAFVLARASRRDDRAHKLCGITAVANAVAAIALVALLVMAHQHRMPTGIGVLAFAAIGCAGFAGAEWWAREPTPGT